MTWQRYGSNVIPPCYNLTTIKKGQLMSNITQLNEIILAIAKSVKEETNYNAEQASNLAYAKALGFAWAILTDDQRQMMLDYYLNGK